MGMDFIYTKAYRQGEILFFKIKPGSLKIHGRLPEKVESGVIREGEKEGHEHKAEGQGELLMFGSKPKPEQNGTKEKTNLTSLFKEEDQPTEGVLKVGEEGAEITHPEHKTLKLPKGEYVVKTQKEATGKNRSQSVKD